MLLVAIVYALVGSLVTGFLFALFPPVSGYRPSRSMTILAAFTFVLLWPFLGLMAMGYLIGRVSRQSRSENPGPPRPTLNMQRRFLYDESHLQN
ncbi:MAG: hypothetical protein P8N76_20470 [Pirellulaceae bacterium]|nr:hypothetical protein [Pirellulaceae bacterium]